MNNSAVIPFPQRDAQSNRPVARERITPQSLESEQSTLGAMLMDRDAIARVVELLGPDDFYRENHRKIFNALLTLFDRGEPVDLITVVEELRRRNHLEDIGGMAYLTALMESCPSSANVDAYAKVVGEKSTLRQIIRATEEIAGWTYGEVDDVNELVDKSEKRIFEIGSRRMKAGFSPIKPILMLAYDQIERQFQRKGEATGISTGYYDLDEITSGLQPTDLIIVAARPSMGKCLAHWTLIDDPQTGERLTIEECVRRRQSHVLNVSRTGRLQTTAISDWIDSGIKPVFRVTTRLGRFVDVTGHHPFLTVGGWTPLHDLKPGDKIAVPRRAPGQGRAELATNTSLNRVRLLAYLSAAGELSQEAPHFAGTDPVVQADFVEALEQEFPSCGTQENSAQVTQWLSALGLSNKASDRAFPASAWTWSRPHLAEFLRVLFSCKGALDQKGDYPRIEFSAESEQLARDVQHALLRFGIVAKLEQDADCWRVEITEPASVLTYQVEIGWVGEKTARCREALSRAVPQCASDAGQASCETWDLIAVACRRRGLSLAKLASLTGENNNPDTTQSIPAWRLQRYAEILQDATLLRAASPDIYWDEIVSIEPLGEHQVYDLTVPDGSNFIAQDVCVHNTALCMNIAHHIALHDRLPVAIFSLEMSKEQLVQRLICSEAMINSRDLRRGYLQDSDWHRVTNAVNNLYQAPIFIDDTPGASTFEMRAKARRLMAEHGQLGLIVVDYLQLAHFAGKNENRVQEISEIARSFKSMARELKVPLIALSQLSRAVEQREDKRPILSDLRESGSIEAEADIVAFIYRPSYYKQKLFKKDKDGRMQSQINEPDPDDGIAEIIIGKQRNGPVGTVRLGFQPDFARFTNLARDPGHDYE